MKLGGEKVGILISESPNSIENPFSLIVSVSFFRLSFSVTVTVREQWKTTFDFWFGCAFSLIFFSFIWVGNS